MTELPPAAAAWVASTVGEDIVETSPLTGGFSSQMHVIRTASGLEVVLRRMTIEPWRRFAEGLLLREYAVQSMLADTPIPAPGPVAVDPGGADAGEPSLLMTRLPGRVDLVRADDEYLDRLARLLVQIHAFSPSQADRPRVYQSWAVESKFEVPRWSTDDGLYKRAFEILREPAPSYEPAFIHRDYHPTNVLWVDGEVTGIVDWVETSTGPVDLDLAHCASNLATLHGVRTALRFRDAYERAGGSVTEDPDASAYWQLMDLVGFLPAGGRESGATATTSVAMWSANGRPDLTPETARAHREDLLRAILS